MAESSGQNQMQQMPKKQAPRQNPVQMQQMIEEFTPQHDSYEYGQEPPSYLHDVPNHEPPYTSPKNGQHRQHSGSSDLSSPASSQQDDNNDQANGEHLRNNREQPGNGVDQPVIVQYQIEVEERKHQSAYVDLSDYKDEPFLMDYKEEPARGRETLYNMRPFNTTNSHYRAHVQENASSAKPIRNTNLLDKKDTSQLEKTSVKQQLPILEDLEEILYLDMQKSAEDRPSISANPLLHHEQQIMLRGKHSEGTATARKPAQSGGENHRLVSATCRYSSWERAHYRLDDDDRDIFVQADEADSIVDSLSRLLAQSKASSEEQEEASEQKVIQGMLKQAGAEASSLRDLALKSCSTEASAAAISDASAVLTGRLDRISNLVAEREQTLRQTAGRKHKQILRKHNVGVDAKRYQSQVHLQRDIYMLIGTVSDLQDRNARLIH